MVSVKERFVVSTEGMRQLQAGRPMWKLVKELIQNCWDEEPEVTTCDIIIQPGEKQRTVLLQVADDGPGFAHIADAYTLMRPTPKRANPTKRGRFNLGEKEIISVATHAVVETVGHTVTFDHRGRTIERNRRTRGTVITMSLPGSKAEIDSLLTMLRLFRPSGSRLTVNGETILSRDPVAVRDAVLPTTLQDGPGLPMRPTQRKTRIDILTPVGEQSWMFEMGIPVQPVDLPFDVDIQQKIPLSPQRDSATPGYLKRVFAEVLNATHDILEEPDFAEPWVKQGLGSPQAEAKAVRTAVKGIAGEKAVLWSSNTDANMKAAEEGYTVVPRGTFGKDEMDAVKQHTEMRTSNDMFGKSYTGFEMAYPNETREAFADWVFGLGLLAGLTVTVEFISASGASMTADCSANTDHPRLRFNVYHLSDKWFGQRGSKQLELVIHELGHAMADTPMEHGPRWGQACCKVAGLIAEGME